MKRGGKKEIHNTRVTNYSRARPGSSWLQRGSHENVLWAGRVVVFRPISPLSLLSLSPSSSRKNRKEKRGGREEGKEYIHRFPGPTANSRQRKNSNASKSSNETIPTQFSLFFQIISIHGFAVNLDSWFVEVFFCPRISDTWVKMFSEKYLKI